MEHREGQPEPESLKFEDVLAEIETQAEEKLNRTPPAAEPTAPRPDAKPASAADERLAKLNEEQRREITDIGRMYAEIRRRIEADPASSAAQELGPMAKELWGAAERNLTELQEGRIPVFAFSEKNVDILAELANIIDGLPPVRERNMFQEKTEDERRYDRLIVSVTGQLERLLKAFTRRDEHPNWAEPAVRLSKLIEEFDRTRRNYLDGQVTGPAFEQAAMSIAQRAAEIQYSTPGLEVG